MSSRISFRTEIALEDPVRMATRRWKAASQGPKKSTNYSDSRTDMAQSSAAIHRARPRRPRTRPWAERVRKLGEHARSRSLRRHVRHERRRLAPTRPVASDRRARTGLRMEGNSLTASPEPTPPRPLSEEVPRSSSTEAEMRCQQLVRVSNDRKPSPNDIAFLEAAWFGREQTQIRENCS
jgi:hypothetical protein